MLDTANRQAGAPGALTADALTALRDTGDVLGSTTSDGVAVYPGAQFHRRNGIVEVRPGLVPFLQTLQGFDPWTGAVLLNTPAPELDNQAPLDWLRDGHAPETVGALGVVVAREWNAGHLGNLTGR